MMKRHFHQIYLHNLIVFFFLVLNVVRNLPWNLHNMPIVANLDALLTIDFNSDNAILASFIRRWLCYFVNNAVSEAIERLVLHYIDFIRYTQHPSNQCHWHKSYITMGKCWIDIYGPYLVWWFGWQDSIMLSPPWHIQAASVDTFWRRQ